LQGYLFFNTPNSQPERAKVVDRVHVATVEVQVLSVAANDCTAPVVAVVARAVHPTVAIAAKTAGGQKKYGLMQGAAETFADSEVGAVTAD
jgi:hypothetical protein